MLPNPPHTAGFLTFAVPAFQLLTSSMLGTLWIRIRPSGLFLHLHTAAIVGIFVVLHGEIGNGITIMCIADLDVFNSRHDIHLLFL